MYNFSTFMPRFKELAQEYQSTFFPSGKVTLLTLEELRENPLYIQVFANTQPKNVVVEKSDTVSLLSKVNKEIFIELIGDNTKTNVGLLKNLSKRMISEMRKSSFAINK